LAASFLRLFQGLDAGLKLVGLLDFALQLYSPKAGVYELVGDSRPTGLEVAGEDLLGEVLQLRLESGELSVGLRPSRSTSCTAPVL